MKDEATRQRALNNLPDNIKQSVKEMFRLLG